MADPKRLKRAAASGWLAGCCAVGVSLMVAVQAFAVVTLSVETTDGVQGGNLTLALSVSREAADPALAGAQTDIVFDTTQIELIGTCANNGKACEGSTDCGTSTCNLPCVKDARLTEQGFTANLPVTVRPPDPAGHRRLRLGVFNLNPLNPATFDSGGLASCTFHVLDTAIVDQAVSLDTSRVVVADPNDGEIPGVQVRVVAGVIHPMPTKTPTPTATPTPTPTIPCFVNRDCPLGQVCDEVTRVCKPAPTPTPTIHCTSDGDCPVPLKCRDNVCRDLSTPTPTPTPLPPCMKDDDCLPGFHCRAQVCVPIRECDDTDPQIDRLMCRGARESCTNGTCECGGDCNLDGYVLGNETSRMVCVLSGQCQLGDCPAGDFNGDGQITGTEVCTAVTNLGLGCPAEGQPLVFDRTAEVRSLDIGSATGKPGDTVTIGVNLSGGGDVATAQLDVLFDTGVLNIPDPTTDCRVDPRISATDAAFTFLPQTPNTPAGVARLRLFVGDVNLCREGLTFPVGSFDAGALLSCTFRINPSAPAGQYTLTAQRLNVGDPRGNEFGSAFTAGTVTVLGLPTATATNTSPITATSTPTTTPTITGTRPTNTPTQTPTVTGPRPTNTPTPVVTRTNTPPAATTTPAPRGHGGGGCTIVAGVPESGSLVWLAVPAALLIWRRRRV